MRERGGTIEYSLDDIREALQLWGDDAPDDDVERRADLEAALSALSDEEVQVLRMWSWGYTYREIAQAHSKPNRSQGQRFVVRALASLRRGMNHAETRPARRAV
jgi:DNA-directed RNA polymerase specialized sigma24 family protein